MDDYLTRFQQGAAELPLGPQLLRRRTGPLPLRRVRQYFHPHADSNYLNDLWRYSLEEASWAQLATLGDTPSPRSNATLNYDPHNQQLVLFGGGGFNK